MPPPGRRAVAGAQSHPVMGFEVSPLTRTVPCLAANRFAMLTLSS